MTCFNQISDRGSCPTCTLVYCIRAVHSSACYASRPNEQKCLLAHWDRWKILIRNISDRNVSWARMQVRSVTCILSHSCGEKGSSSRIWPLTPHFSFLNCFGFVAASLRNYGRGCSRARSYIEVLIRLGRQVFWKSWVNHPQQLNTPRCLMHTSQKIRRWSSCYLLEEQKSYVHIAIRTSRSGTAANRITSIATITPEPSETFWLG